MALRRRQRRPQPRREAEVEITSIGARGDGVATVDGAQIFVPLTAPGDVARIAYGGARGVITELLRPGPHRAEPACPHYGTCGGCAMQHVDEAFYRDWKQRLVIDVLVREGYDAGLVAPAIFCASATRRRATFAVVKPRGRPIMGYHARASKTVVAISACPVLEPLLDEAVPALRAIAEATPADWRQFDLHAVLTDAGLDVCLQGDFTVDDLPIKDIERLIAIATQANLARLSVNEETLALFAAPVVRFDNITVAPPPGGFLQASRQGEAALQRLVCGNVSGAKTIADLFCGCGTFALPMAKGAAVSAFDADALSIGALSSAAEASDLARPVAAQVRNLFDRPLLASELNAFGAVVFDPPRAGARSQAVEIAASTVPVVIGVSCNPSSFVRDAGILRDGGYTLTQVTPVDQFVFSPHVELVGVFRKG